MPKTKPVPTERFAIKGCNRKKPVKSAPVLFRGIRRLRAARKRLLAKEYRELRRILKQPDSRETALAKLERIDSLERKANLLLRKRLKQKDWIARHDSEFPLLLNKRFFFDMLKQRLTEKGAHSLIYIDVDRLKPINTRFGRAQGGFELLSAYSKALAQSARKTGFAGHIGGDEFVLYLPMTARESKNFLTSTFGPLRLKQLRRWAKYKEATTLKKLTLTYSAGIIQLKQGAELKRAEEAADLLCNKAKKQSRKKNTFSIRSSLEKFEAELAKKKARI